eukprot:5482261-Pleurochrysis_carterae.AAC.3
MATSSCHARSDTCCGQTPLDASCVQTRAGALQNARAIRASVRAAVSPPKSLALSKARTLPLASPLALLLEPLPLHLSTQTGER